MTGNTTLKGKRVAILAETGVEQDELQSPRKALEQAGAKVDLISPQEKSIKTWHNNKWGDDLKVDVSLSLANPDSYDALMLPGGVINADKLRTNKQAVKFAHDFFTAGKPVAAICHAPWLLIEANVVRGRSLTSWPSLETDLTNAGADWSNKEVVADEGLVTSRQPADLPAFNAKMIEEFAEGVHQGQRSAVRNTKSYGPTADNNRSGWEEKSGGRL